MPSIPQSLLWISLVVLWLFVLVPMLISKRDAVRRTSDVALATRVLNGGAGSRLIKRSGPAAGHRSDPNWKPEDEPVDDELADAETQDLRAAAAADAATDSDERAPVAMKMAAPENSEPDYLDVDVIEDSAALPAAASEADSALVAVDEEDSGRDENDSAADEYEYVDDSSGLEPEADADEHAEEDDGAWANVPHRSRRRRFDPKKAAAIDARKYAFRKRVLMVMAVVLVGSATAAFEVSPTAWWLCGTATAVTVLYLAYLRRQTRIEERIRRRRMQRMARARLGVENAYDRDYDVVPSRLRRPGAVVLEIDDEDPIFEHLDDVAAMRAYGGWPRDLPRAVGQ
ncbi:divisome protein SepX/GlpR [Mycobacterium sp. Marseille-P9652]|uniref:divisome protein SepX/GlpR n=1 Tax=Mycobacterium sp. Marseille-P9652 TaxID=2654950 RepID=UPI0012E8A8F8|nr:gephyrin-like molybdotransferase receptor GlpR [Mycobacterium sp. Marseille-P9652]